MAEVEVRSATLDDVAAAVAVMNAESQRIRGRDDVNEVAVRGWWTQPPPFDLTRDVVLATRDGVIVGYGDLSDQAHDGMTFWLDVRGDAIAETHAELERRALSRVVAGGVVRAVADHADDRYQQYLSEQGYGRIRSSYRMGIELVGRSFEAQWPAGARLRTAREGTDEPLMHGLVEQSFADHWGFTPAPYDEWLHWLREMGDYDPSLCFIVEVDGVPAGVEICQPGEWGEPDRGWVGSLGVLPSFRGRGLGYALLMHAFAEFADRGQPRAGLGVDAENTTGALRLYERAGMRVLEQQDIWERRP
jgi:ribosomal protein S18 acetylase RimI-like enzyme